MDDLSMLVKEKDEGKKVVWMERGWKEGNKEGKKEEKEKGRKLSEAWSKVTVILKTEPPGS